jgi:hypothetical protein
MPKPRGGQSFRAERKAEPTTGNSGLNFTAEQDIGAVGGVGVSVRASVGTDGLIGKQGVSIEANATNNTLKVGAGLGSARGKLGGNIGAILGHDENGNTVVKGAEVAINIGGFGGEVSVDDEGNTKLGISVAGVRVEVARDENGRKTLSICYSIPGGEICAVFEPEPETELPPMPEPEPQPVTPDPDKGISVPGTDQLMWVPCSTRKTYPDGVWIETRITVRNKNEKAADAKHLPFEMEVSEFSSHSGEREGARFTVDKGTYMYNFNMSTEGIDPRRGFFKIQKGSSNAYKIWYYGEFGGFIDSGTNINKLIDANNANNGASPNAQYLITFKPVDFIPVGEVKSKPNRASNRPNQIKPMNCCDKVEKIYKYLGIEKIERKKLKMAKAFLVPGGTGDILNDDYYEVVENIIRMLANGTIISPKMSPLGVDWQTPNATAWAQQVYEMAAESMRNGNSTQVFEMHSGATMVQLMKAIAELTSKVDALSQAVGFTPVPKPGEFTSLFTIHEEHKAFDPKIKKKEIDITKPKTDAEVEKVLSKMLKPSQIPYIQYTFNPNGISIAQAISKL